jgi:hypothetical protein
VSLRALRIGPALQDQLDGFLEIQRPDVDRTRIVGAARFTADGEVEKVPAVGQEEGRDVPVVRRLRVQRGDGRGRAARGRNTPNDPLS